MFGVQVEWVKVALKLRQPIFFGPEVPVGMRSEGAPIEPTERYARTCADAEIQLKCRVPIRVLPESGHAKLQSRFDGFADQYPADQRQMRGVRSPFLDNPSRLEMERFLGIDECRNVLEIDIRFRGRTSGHQPTFRLR